MSDHRRRWRHDEDAEDRDLEIERRARALMEQGFHWLAALELASRGNRRTGAPAGVPGKLARSARLPGHDAAPDAELAMRSADGDDVSPDAPAYLARARGRGAALDPALRDSLEAALGTRLADVRVHTGPDADAAARALSARAFAVGSDLFFRDGAYDPTSRDGLHLIAHEVAHTVQSPGAGPAGVGLAVSHPGDALEREADTFADRFVEQPARPRTGAPLAARPVAGAAVLRAPSSMWASPAAGKR